MNWIRKHRPSPAIGIALAALVVALGGAAFAAIPDSSGTIHGCYQKSNGGLRVVESADECRSSEGAVAWNQQGPPGPPGEPGAGGGRVISAEELGEVSTQSDQFVDLGGPCATVTISNAGLVSIFARAELKAMPGLGNGGAAVGLYDSTAINPALQIMSTTSETYIRLWTTQGGFVSTFDDEQAGSSGTELRGGHLSGFTTVEASPGVHTFCLRYRSRGGDADTAFFRERKLWVEPVA